MKVAIGLASIALAFAILWRFLPPIGLSEHPAIRNPLIGLLLPVAILGLAVVGMGLIVSWYSG
jgi:hypothetical protein